MLIVAFKPDDQAFSLTIPWASLTLDNFRYSLEASPWLTYYINGTLAVTLTFVGQLLICLPAGYVLARSRIRGSAVLMGALLIILLIPQQVRAIPTYFMISQVGLIDTIAALVIPFLGSAFMVFLFRQFIVSIPQETFDAAWMDGVGRIGVLWHVVVPAVKPAIAAGAAFSMVEHWNDLFWPSLTVRSDASATVPYAISYLASAETGIRYGPLMAAAVLSIAPLVVLFIVLQRYMIEGVSASRTI
ncbi:carbohydrate ABC transporter permease [Phytohabitans sp. ZYX-F-186]|uniref:Carbohydrate ABC transporter permease n=1 Tax=Phytohabitans maris TaxID=3071409 RepID=A0ABU0ZQY4_9ACTN|nr:carbohydrate ABC transporter permease [Phytohabitans sp. ZYX-F-186]MDQ7908754.1 carbohydrate ABC transporter permease [Phytohabitans sp. ZYX-F-186]